MTLPAARRIGALQLDYSTGPSAARIPNHLSVIAREKELIG
jgi:hypothetical protein